MEKKLNYSFSNAEVNYLLRVLDRVQTAGVRSAQDLIAMVQKLQQPENSAELEKETLEQLKAKYEKDTKKK